MFKDCEPDITAVSFGNRPTSYAATWILKTEVLKENVLDVEVFIFLKKLLKEWVVLDATNLAILPLILAECAESLGRQDKFGNKIECNWYASHNNSIRESLLTGMHPHKRWSTLKTFLFGVNSSLPSIYIDYGSFSYDPSKKVEVFSTIFLE